MNVYDFDKTIFYPDSSATFLKWSFAKYPRYFKDSLLSISTEAYKYYIKGNNDISLFKEKLFSFLKFVPNPDELVHQFWNEHIDRIADWYIQSHHPDDLIISASPYFLLKPVAEMLGVELICTDMNKYSGQINGVNCSGIEKLKKFREKYPQGVIDNFYSDSVSDLPLASIAKKAYLVRNGCRLVEWKK